MDATSLNTATNERQAGVSDPQSNVFAGGADITQSTQTGFVIVLAIG